MGNQALEVDDSDVPLSHHLPNPNEEMQKYPETEVAAVKKYLSMHLPNLQ